MPLRRLLLLVASCLTAPLVCAQSPSDVLRGRVTDDSSRAVVGAAVFVTRGPDRAVKQDTTDADGRYSVTFENGTGDYLVAVSAPGLKSARRRVQRQNSERVLVADFVLARDLTQLAAVRVTANAPTRAGVGVGPATPEVGANERWSDGVNGQIAPSQLGNLNAVAGNLPGVVQGPGGVSILASGGESNLTTLNGLALPGGSLPRSARVETRVTGATYDPLRGGFSGANVDVRLQAGSRSYQQRDAFLTLDPQPLQFTDVIGRSLGAPSGAFRAGASANGEIIRQAFTYNVALDASRSVSDPATLVSGDLLAQSGAGVSPDSVARVVAAANALGVPIAGTGIPLRRERTGYALLGRFDDIRDSLNSRYITTIASQSREGALGFGPLAAPSNGGEQLERGLGAQFQANTYFGPGRRLLNQTRASIGQQLRDGDPYLLIPGASVLVRSTGADGDGVVPLSLGGAAALAARDERWTGEASTTFAWNARGRKHNFKAYVWGRGDALAQDGGADRLGRFSYNSLADFQANRPASFSRVLAIPDRRGRVWNAATAVAHQWNPSRWLSILYGARVEGSGALTTPDANAALESQLGVRTAAPRTRLHVSPRIGFSYTYSRARDNGGGMSSGNTGVFYRTPTGVFRGGIGEFRDLLRPDLLADASARTGLPGSTLILGCTGSAVPSADWSAFVTDPSTVPSRCADGSGVLADAAPPATVVSPAFDVPRSWRASLDWSTTKRWLVIGVRNLVSYDLAQPSVRDVNFAGTERFTLAQEGGRPVYVSPASIDAASGAVSPVESRSSAAFGRVAVRGSELRGYGAQTTLSLMPDVWKLRNVRFAPYGSVNYTLQTSRRQYLGFDGTTGGDPRLREWAPSAADARHIVILQGALAFPFGVLSVFGRAQSGLPFTPIVQGDVNGDGRGGDRAFVPSRSLPLDAALATQLAALEQAGSRTAQRCLAAWAGRVVDRHGCRGPWTATMNAQFRARMPKRWERLTANLFFENVLAGVDQAVHGSRNLRGWGAAPVVDPVLLVPRAFDAASRSFRYDVNPRFAETRPQRTTLRAPFRVTLDFSLRLSTDFDLQELRRAIEPKRTPRGWQRRSEDSLTAHYLKETSNIYTAILAESDSLFLTTDQIAQLRAAEDSFSIAVRAIYRDLARYLAPRSDGADKAALDTSKAAKQAYWRVFWDQPEKAAEMLTPQQRSLMPLMQNISQVPKASRATMQWYFGSPVKMPAAPVAPPAPIPVRP